MLGVLCFGGRCGAGIVIREVQIDFLVSVADVTALDRYQHFRAYTDYGSSTGWESNGWDLDVAAFLGL